MRVLFLAPCLALGSCVAAPIVGPVQMIDGIPTRFVSCPGSDDLSACHEAAADICETGKYNVLAEAQERQFAGRSTKIPHIVITCRTADGHTYRSGRADRVSSRQAFDRL
jgi:hypothetical protein